MKSKKNIIIMLVITMFLAVFPVKRVYAEDVSVATVKRQESNAMVRADRIVTKYRVYDGKLQYRRWNETRGYWVDSKWLSVS